MAGLIKKILRAAVAQPWEYVGDGAPDDWEFRVSPDEAHIAVFGPDHGHWSIIDSRTGMLVAEESNLEEMDRNTADWRQFLSVEDPDD